MGRNFYAETLFSLFAESVEIHFVFGIADVVAGRGTARGEDMFERGAFASYGGDFGLCEYLLSEQVLEFGDLLFEVIARFIACAGHFG